MAGQRWEADLPILYNTLAVYQSGLTHPLNDWTPQHSCQGFSWRPGSVSFRTLDLDTISDPVIVEVSNGYTLPPAARRVIRVPFEVGNTGVEVTSPVMDSWRLAVSRGIYALYFSIESIDEEGWQYHLTLVPSHEPVAPEILRADDDLNPPQQLLMEALPAI